MIKIASKSVSIMVMYAVSLHLTWAALVYWDATAMNATAVHALYQVVPSQTGLAATIATAAVLATIGLFTRRPWIVLLLIPQQFLLMASAAGAFEAIWLSQFADGVVRSRYFLAADQIYSILAAVGHTVALMAHSRRVVQ